MYQVSVIFSIQGRPKYAQIGIFGTKICMPSGNPGFERIFISKVIEKSEKAIF
jgi:hypothetical protein